MSAEYWVLAECWHHLAEEYCSWRLGTLARKDWRYSRYSTACLSSWGQVLALEGGEMVEAKEARAAVTWQG